MKLIVLVTILLVSAVFAGINNRYLQEKPFHKEFMMDYPSGSTAGANGDLYVIDKSKQRIELSHRTERICLRFWEETERKNLFMLLMICR